MPAIINLDAMVKATVLKGWSFIDLQKEAGLSSVTLYSIRKKGGRCLPSTMARIAKALGVDVTEIVTFPDGGGQQVKG